MRINGNRPTANLNGAANLTGSEFAAGDQRIAADCGILQDGIGNFAIFGNPAIGVRLHG